jgi:hypothetical protein
MGAVPATRGRGNASVCRNEGAEGDKRCRNDHHYHGVHARGDEANRASRSLRLPMIKGREPPTQMVEVDHVTYPQSATPMWSVWMVREAISNSNRNCSKLPPS